MPRTLPVLPVRRNSIAATRSFISLGNESRQLCECSITWRFWCRGGKANFDMVNLFAYVGNDPLDRTDPSGMVFDDYVSYGDPLTDRINAESRTVGSTYAAEAQVALIGGAFTGGVAYGATGAIASTETVLTSGAVTAVLGTASGNDPMQVAKDSSNSMMTTAVSGGAAGQMETRMGKALAIGVATASTARSQGATGTEAVVGGFAAGAAELATGNIKVATSFGAAIRATVRLGLTALKKEFSNAMKTEVKKVCAGPDIGGKC